MSPACLSPAVMSGTSRTRAAVSGEHGVTEYRAETARGGKDGAKMTTVDQQIENAAAAISANIAALRDDRPLLAQNILSQLRNLVEGAAVRLQAGGGGGEFQYSAVKAAISHVGSKAQVNFVARFHKLLQISSSHYTLGGDPSERLMLKYYDYLLRIRTLASAQFGLSILNNLENFPVDLDPSLKEYHEKIAERILAMR